MRKTISFGMFLLILLMETSFYFANGQDLVVQMIPTNTYAHSNIAPFVLDSSLIFSSNRKLSTFRNYFNADGDYVYRLYQVRVNKSQLIGEIHPFLASEASRLNVSNITVSKDGNYMIVCQNSSEDIKNTNGKRGNTYNLYFSERNLSGKWSRLKALPLTFKRLSNLVHPSLSPDGRFLAFASDASDGMGKFDIYITEKVGGVWQEPKNAGRGINTEGNELYPFFVTNDKIYFSSDARFGVGGMDIFVSVLKKGVWDVATILPQPINSADDDFACYINSDELSGYFSSNRKSGDQVYYFEQQFPDFTTVANEQIIDTFCYSFAETSTDKSENLVYVWNFGDGGTAKGLEAEHCFVGPGNYKVVLNVVDPITKEELYAAATYDLPLDYTQQVFITSKDTVMVGETVKLDASNSKLGELVPKDYYWIIGNKDRKIGESITHVFDKKGSYIILCGVVSRENPNERMASTKIIVVK